jgi:prepilin-type N-terminal cleavage/methylation domain-containing protein
MLSHDFARLRKKILCRVNHQRGFGLVETLVAIAILGVSITAFVTDLSAGSIAVRIQNENAVAQGLAQNQMEVIKASPYDKSGQSYPIVDSLPGYDIEITTSDVFKGNANKTIQQVSIAIKHNDAVVLILEGYKVNR